MLLRKAPILALLLAIAWLTPAEASLAPYEASYSIYRNGKLIGTLEIVLEIKADRWQLSSLGSGSRGLARLLRATDRERVSGRLVDGRFLPETHTRHTRVAGFDDRWEARFDWEADTVTVTHDKKKTYVLELRGEALDPLSMKLEMRRRLMNGDTELGFLMVDEDEIDEENFRLLESELIETSLGCFNTLPIEKIRSHNRRYTRAWHAPELGNIEVRVEHGKVDGDHMEMRINELFIDGEAVVPGPGCEAVGAASITPSETSSPPAGGTP